MALGTLPALQGGLYPETVWARFLIIVIFASISNSANQHGLFSTVSADRSALPLFGVFPGTLQPAGDGLIKRDFLYIEDCMDALLLLAVNDQATGQAFNVGRDQPSNFLEMAKAIAKATGGGYEHTGFSAERKAQEPGDFYCDFSKIRAVTGWPPSTSLDEGDARTVSN